MKSILFLTLTIYLAGCSATAIKEDKTNPDGSREVVSGGNVFSKKEDVLSSAKKRADLLCKNGFTTNEESCDNENKISCVLKFTCK